MDLDKLFEKLPYDSLYPVPAWQRMGALVGVSVLIIALVYYFVLSGQVNELSGLEGSLAKKQNEVNANRDLNANKTKFEDKIAELEGKLEVSKKYLPQEKEIPLLLEKITEFGTQSGLEFLVFKPSGEVEREFYSEVSIKIEVNGTFHNVLRFFDRIANMDRIVTVSNISMQKGKKDSGASIKTSLSAVTYRYIEPKEDPAKGGKPGAKKGTK